jgi:hypothetical protein
MIDDKAMDSFQQELTKLAFSGVTPQDEVEGFHISERKDWSRFDKNLRRKDFRAAAVDSSLSDKKLKRYVKNYGGYLTSKEVVAGVPSRTSKKTYALKELPTGRLACNCKDWQYRHSVRGTDCDHIKLFKKSGLHKTASADVEKVAARAGARFLAKNLGRLLSRGEEGLETAQRVARATGAGRVNGSQVKMLGQGGEGVADLMAHRNQGLVVRKLFNPEGISGEAMIKRKEIAGRALRDNPHVARFHGAAKTEHGGNMHFSEFVPGMEASKAGPQMEANIRAAKAGVLKGLRRAGFQGGQDIRAANMMVTPSGQVKAFDMMPNFRQEFVRPNRSIRQARPNELFGTEKVFEQGVIQEGRRVTHQSIRANAFRGAPLQDIRRAAPKAAPARQAPPRQPVGNNNVTVPKMPALPTKPMPGTQQSLPMMAPLPTAPKPAGAASGVPTAVGRAGKKPVAPAPTAVARGGKQTASFGKMPTTPFGSPPRTQAFGAASLR